jgi:hypothetical protein
VSALNFTSKYTLALFTLLVLIDWQFGTRLATGHTAPVAATILYQAEIGKGA